MLFPKKYGFSVFNTKYSWLSLPWNRKGPNNLFKIERVRDRERIIGYSPHRGTEILVRDREKFDIEIVWDRESQLYMLLNFGWKTYFKVKAHVSTSNMSHSSQVKRKAAYFISTLDFCMKSTPKHIVQTSQRQKVDVLMTDRLNFIIQDFHSNLNTSQIWCRRNPNMRLHYTDKDRDR